MNIPFEILKAQRCHVDEAIQAALALRDGFITIGECLAIISLAIDWCEFVNRFYGIEIYG